MVGEKKFDDFLNAVFEIVLDETGEIGVIEAIPADVVAAVAAQNPQDPVFQVQEVDGIVRIIEREVSGF